MKNKILFGISILGIAMAVMCFTACQKKELRSSMLMDLDMTITEEDRVIAKSSEPVPLPDEPYLLELEEEVSSAMLEDIDILTKEKPSIPLKQEEMKPKPLPDEPKPLKEKK